MKKLVSIIYLLLFCNLAFAQKKTKIEGNFTLSKKQAQQDLNILKSVLHEIHPGQYRFISKASVNSSYQEVLNDVHSDTSVLELYRKVLKIVAKIGCGHTWAQVPDSLSASLWNKHYGMPFEVTIRKGKLFCSKLLVNGLESIAIGDELLEINGKSVRPMIKEFKKLAIADGFSERGKTSWVANKFDFYHRLVYGLSNDYTVKYRNSEGKECTLVIPVRSEGNVLTNKKKIGEDNQKAIVFHVPENSNSASLKISTFSADDSAFGNQLSQIFKKIASENISNLIVDLRGNRGGMDSLGRLLLSYLLEDGMEQFKRVYVKTIDPKFREFTDISEDEVAGLSQITTKVNDTLFLLKKDFMDVTIRPKAPHFSGKLYVLIDGRTFSTAADVAAILRSKTDAIFIGKETGGGYYGNNSGAMVNLTLPNSGIKVRIPAVGYETNVAKIFPKGSGIKPHHEIYSEPSPLSSHQDNVLDFTNSLIKNNTK